MTGVSRFALVAMDSIHRAERVYEKYRLTAMHFGVPNLSKSENDFGLHTANSESIIVQ